ncbi:MAG: YciI family protein [Fimbriimonadaceae bacterium]|nr:YciI family protein [Fimbriimonadaceae bacterium]
MKVLLSIFHPTVGPPPDAGIPEAAREIDALNDEMMAAGVRVFVGGLRPAAEAVVIDPSHLHSAHGPAIGGDSQIGGLWVLEVADMEAAIEWGHKASRACRTRAEVRPFN